MQIKFAPSSIPPHHPQADRLLTLYHLDVRYSSGNDLAGLRMHLSIRRFFPATVLARHFLTIEITADRVSAGIQVKVSAATNFPTNGPQPFVAQLPTLLSSQCSLEIRGCVVAEE